jgi:hypothetical protein
VPLFLSVKKPETMGFIRIRPMQGGDKTRPNSSKAQGPALSQKKGISEAELSTCPILVKLRAKGFTERKDLCPQLN